MPTLNQLGSLCTGDRFEFDLFGRAHSYPSRLNRESSGCCCDRLHPDASRMMQCLAAERQYCKSSEVAQITSRACETWQNVPIWSFGKSCLESS
eukprot:s3589_g5.t1